jgi:hypothetical protein
MVFGNSDSKSGTVACAAHARVEIGGGSTRCLGCCGLLFSVRGLWAIPPYKLKQPFIPLSDPIRICSPLTSMVAKECCFTVCTSTFRSFDALLTPPSH